MFKCKYDGYEEDTSSEGSSDERDFTPADNFEEIMRKELQSDIDKVAQLVPSSKKSNNVVPDQQTNDDLLYDPEEDDENADWVNQMQKNNQCGPTGGISTDAVLNCPGCMTLLSLNCQRHSKYKTQYRTMFTFNCKVDTSEILYLPAGAESPSLATALDLGSNQTGSTNGDTFHRVLCEICDTAVGLKDSVGVYHLFGVLASHS